MSPIPNPHVIYAKLPEGGYPVPGEHLVYEATSKTIDLDNVPLNGGSLVKTAVLSLDPYLRNLMRDPKIVSYAPAFEIGNPVSSFAIVTILRTESKTHKVGDHVISWSNTAAWKEYQVLSDGELNEPISNPSGLPLYTFLSVAGATARTAFYSLRAFAEMKKGETIFVSTAAGGVGSIVVQLAKLAGLKVIGSTGDDDKVAYLKNELGIDVAFNYKKTSVWDVLKEHGPINIYYDNAGGEMLDAALLNATQGGARFIMCGYASEYNRDPSTKPYGITNASLIFSKQIKLSGFIVTALLESFGFEPWINEYIPLITSGKISQRTYVVKGLDNAAEGFANVLKGNNPGKGVVVLDG